MPPTPPMELQGLDMSVAQALRGPNVDVHDTGWLPSTDRLPRAGIAPNDGLVLQSSAASIDAASMQLLGTLQRHGLPGLDTLNGPPLAAEGLNRLCQGFTMLRESNSGAAGRLLARIKSCVTDFQRGLSVLENGHVTPETAGSAEQFLVAHRTLRRGLGAMADMGRDTEVGASKVLEVEEFRAAASKLLEVEAQLRAVMGVADPIAEAREGSSTITATMDLWREELKIKVDGVTTSSFPFSAEEHAFTGLGSLGRSETTPSAATLQQLGLAIVARTPNLWSEAPLFMVPPQPTVDAEVDIGKPKSSRVFEDAAKLASRGMPQGGKPLAQYGAHVRAGGYDFVGVFTLGERDTVRIVVDNEAVQEGRWDWGTRKVSFPMEAYLEPSLAAQAMAELSRQLSETLPATRGDLRRAIQA